MITYTFKEGLAKFKITETGKLVQVGHDNSVQYYIRAEDLGISAVSNYCFYSFKPEKDITPSKMEFYVESGSNASNLQNKNFVILDSSYNKLYHQTDGSGATFTYTATPFTTKNGTEFSKDKIILSMSKYPNSQITTLSAGQTYWVGFILCYNGGTHTASVMEDKPATEQIIEYTGDINMIAYANENQLSTSSFGTAAACPPLYFKLT